MKRKNLRFEVKEISEQGYFEGLLSPYNNVDGGGDIVLPGAYTKTIKEQGNTRPLLWQHKQAEPIGLLTLEDRPDGLWCKGQLEMVPEIPEALKAYRLMKAKIVRGLSIGFDSIKEQLEGATRKLTEIKLYEGSVVTFPMNESALITSVKGRRETKNSFNVELTEQQLRDARWQMFNALQNALCSVIWADFEADEKVSVAATVIDEFRTAYLEYFPQYLDMLSTEYGAPGEWKTKSLEFKAGRRISAATKETLTSAHSQMKSATDLIYALLDDEAGEDDDNATSESKAAPAPGKTEPVIDHSAIATKINELKGALEWK